MSKETQEFEGYLFGGRAQWKALPVHDEGGELEAYDVLFMDVEYDPIRVSVDFDGVVTMPAKGNGYAWVMMTPEMLVRLAEICKKIREKHRR